LEGSARAELRVRPIALQWASHAESLEQFGIAYWRSPMPLVNVKLIEGVFTPMQKQEMIRKLTDTMVSIEGENMRPVTWVVIEEVTSGDWGIGGKPLATNDVKSLAAGKPQG
jgi:4-oxalocrotonate tautomerase